MADKFNKAKLLAEVKDLKLRLGSGKKLIIDEAAIKVREGEILGIIGESGSGKTVLTSTLTGLNVDIQTIDSGSISIQETDVTDFDFNAWAKSGLRGRKVSTVFQNPLSSLNPYRKIGSQIIESILTNTDEDISQDEAYNISVELLEKVKIHNAEEVMRMYPHQMSGGMNQRIVIVTILAAKPDLIIFDEPTTALDPLAQAQIIEIIREIRDETNVGMIFISHDIALVSSIADTIAIMYAGRVIEQGTAEEVIKDPKHPYTWGLLMSMPDYMDGSDDELYSIRGIVPTNIEEVKGDSFAPRNDYALEIDFEEKPPKFKITDTHFVYSWLYHKNAPKFELPKAIQKAKKK